VNLSDKSGGKLVKAVNRFPAENWANSSADQWHQVSMSNRIELLFRNFGIIMNVLPWM
jgi:hypothetical protein